MLKPETNKAFWWTLSAIWAGFIFWLSSSPGGQGGFWLIQMIPYGDKLAHGFVFGVLAFCLHMASGRWWLALGSSALYGMSDEFHQSFVPGRSVDISDWIADTLGALVAVIFVSFLTQRQRR